MKQTTKFLHIVMCMVLGLSVSMTSCKDYDDDIDGLTQRVDELENSLTQLSTDFGELAYVQSVTYNDETRTLTVVTADGKSQTYTVSDEVGDDTNTTYELVVSPNGKGDILVELRGSDGKTSGGQFTLPAASSFDPNMFYVDPNTNMLWYDNVQTSVVIPEATEPFNAKDLKIENDYLTYKGEQLFKLNTFNPNALTVNADGQVLYYGEPTQITIPQVEDTESNVVIGSITNEGGTVTGYIVTYKEGEGDAAKTVNFKLLPNALKSMVFVPEAYLNGVEAMKARYVKANAWVAGEYPEATINGEPAWKQTEDAVANPVKIVAYYHVNPSNVDLNTIKNVYFVVDNKEVVMTKSGEEFDAKLVGKELADGKLKLTFTINGAALATGSNEMTVVAVQAEVEDPMNANGVQLVTSDYAAILNTTINSLSLAPNKEAGYEGRGGALFTSGSDAIMWNTFLPGFGQTPIKVYNNSASEKVQLQDYVLVKYTETSYDGTVLNSQNPYLSVEDMENLGLGIRFRASDYLISNGFDAEKNPVYIHANELYTVDSLTGEVTVKEFAADGKTSSVGKMPIVRVELYNLADRNVVAVGWMALLIQAGNPIAVTPEVDFGEIYWGCQDDTLHVTADFMNTNIFTKLGLTQEEFHSIYRMEANEAVTEDKEAEENILTWIISGEELRAAKNGEVLTTQVIYTAADRENVTITLKATVKYPTASAVGDRIKEYWGNDGKHNYVRLNAVTDGSGSSFTTDLLNVFVGNKLKVEVDKAFESFQNLKYSFIFSADNERTIEVNGEEYELYVGANADTLYAKYTDGDEEVVEPVAVLSGTANAAKNSTITYQNNKAAKALLNKAAHDQINENGAFYALVEIKATSACEDEDCQLAYPLTDNVFKAYFLRPIDVISAENPAELQDAGNSQMSEIRLLDFIKLIDWRNESFEDNKDLYNAYGVKEIVALVGDNKDENHPVYTSLNGGSLTETTLESVTDSLVLGGVEGSYDGGTLTLQNNGINIGDYKLNVPVKVSYKWGEVIEYIIVNVKGTSGN